MKILIQSIITNPTFKIHVDNCFDAHFIIQLLIENYSDDYFKFVCNYSINNDIARIAHSQISIILDDLAKVGILEKMSCKSVSFNIHHNPSECGLWKRIL